MARFVALVSGFGRHVQDLARAARDLDIELITCKFTSLVGQVGVPDYGVFSKGLDIESVDAVLVRMVPPGSLEQVIVRVDTLRRLELLGTVVVNPSGAIETCVDKYLSLATLETELIAVPPTWVGETAEEALVAFEWLGGDVVVKPIFGSEGRGIVRVSQLELARRVFHTLENMKAILYLQAYIPTDGHDLRVFVLGDRVLGAIRRHAAAGEWRTNVSLGGRVEAVELDPALTRTALAAAEAVDASIAGVDIVVDRRDGRHLVLEVNAVPGWRGLSAATGVDVASEILIWMRERAK